MRDCYGLIGNPLFLSNMDCMCARMDSVNFADRLAVYIGLNEEVFASVY